jgi:hypothetical protein
MAGNIKLINRLFDENIPIDEIYKKVVKQNMDGRSFEVFEIAIERKQLPTSVTLDKFLQSSSYTGYTPELRKRFDNMLINLSQLGYIFTISNLSNMAKNCNSINAKNPEIIEHVVSKLNLHDEEVQYWLLRNGGILLYTVTSSTPVIRAFNDEYEYGKPTPEIIRNCPRLKVNMDIIKCLIKNDVGRNYLWDVVKKYKIIPNIECLEIACTLTRIDIAGYLIVEFGIMPNTQCVYNVLNSKCHQSIEMITNLYCMINKKKLSDHQLHIANM